MNMTDTDRQNTDLALVPVNDPLVQVEHLSKHFALEAGFFSKVDRSVYAVNDVSFSVYRGQTYGLVGESGCGKTTTARMIVGMYTPNEGRVLYSGTLPPVMHGGIVRPGAAAVMGTRFKDIGRIRSFQMRVYREKIKYIFQDPARSLNPRMKVYDVLTAALRYSSQWKGEKDAAARAAAIIEEVGLTAADLERHPSELSGGQRQRISIARGLIMQPELLICDEVVSALDVSIQGQILNLLQDIRAKRNLSFVFIAHDLKVSCWFCDVIGVMYRGMLVEEAPAASLYKDALHPYTKLLFDGAKGTAAVSSVEVKTTFVQENSCPFAHRCPLADDTCRTVCPELTERSPGHKVRCHKA